MVNPTNPTTLWGLCAATALVLTACSTPQRPEPPPATPVQSASQGASQSAPQSAHPSTQFTQAAWRAASRLGYGPVPSGAAAPQMQVLQTNPKAWALQQLHDAYVASQQNANVPADQQRFNASLPSLLADYRAEREAQKVLREVKASAMQSMAAGATPTVEPPKPENFSRDAAQTAAAWRLMACSDPAIENALLARMTEFWFNHLNVFVGKGTVRPFVGHYVVHVIRANALGKFEDLLLASAKHPAMLMYLDQAQSVAPGTNKGQRGLNENYARELMELHTLGVNTVYTQNDVRELARILTGWTVDINKDEGFRFTERLHDSGSKTLLGTTYSNRGLAEGEDAIRSLARHPATAQRISARLATFFVADKPPAALVQRLAKSFTATQGDIRAVMRTLIESPEFWQADQTLFKTPMDYACSVLTTAGGAKDKRDINQSLGFLSQAGQPLHGWQTPDGYKTDAATWLAPEAITRRADYAMGMAPRMSEPVYLQSFLSPATLERIAREAPALRVGLMLSSPEFMSK